MTAADRPSVTDNARAEAVEAIKAHLTEFLVDHDAEEFAWNILNDLCEVGWAAGRAETTTALPRPGDGCQCTWHNEDRGGGHYELVAEYEPACPEHSEHVWNPRTGMWEHRAETTTATTEDAARVIEEALYEATQDPNDIEVPAVARRLHGLLSARGLLATARTRPTREDVARVLFHRVHPGGVWGAVGGEGFLRDADAVLALLADHGRAAHLRGGA